MNFSLTKINKTTYIIYPLNKFHHSNKMNKEIGEFYNNNNNLKM